MRYSKKIIVTGTLVLFSIFFKDVIQAKENILDQQNFGEITNLYKEWTITFNENVDPSSISTSSISIKDEKGENIPISIVVNENKITVKPKKAYKNHLTYILYISNNIKNIRSLPLAKGYEVKFFTNTVDQNGHYTTTWLWNPWMLMEYEKSIIAFLINQKVNKVYLQIDYDIPINVYRNFIEKSSKNGIQIYALAGEEYWVSSNYKEYSDELKKWFDTYQKQSTFSQKFSGIHLDIEPYQNSNWETNQAESIRIYQTFIQEAANYAKNVFDVPLEVDIPFWFDEVYFENEVGSGNLAEWVIQQTESVTIMAYRDTAPEIIDIVKDELVLANKYGKSIIVGVETIPSKEGDFVSFYEEGLNYMMLELEKVNNYYKDLESFKGIGIHHVESWSMME